MSALKANDLAVMKRHHRALCHLRERKKSERIALFFGAGASKQLGFPKWGDLLDRIQKQPEFEGEHFNYTNTSLLFRAQAMIQYLQRKERTNKKTNIIDAAAEKAVRHKWISIVHRCLYETAFPDDELKNHPYLTEFLFLIKEAPLTINYNFDDSIERMLAQRFEVEQLSANERVYETVWDPSTQYQRSSGVIYHPNGFLPKKMIDGYSDSIVFAEGEFADQLVQSMQGHYSTLVSHLSRYTSLMIGLSLDDPTLKHLLRQNTFLNPGHVHYWLKYCEKIPDARALKEEQEINYELYGVITLHVTEDEFASFGRLLSCSDDEYANYADSLSINIKQLYYITGAVGVGKSSAVQKMKSLSWIGEWVESKPENLAKPHTELTDQERLELDEWVSNQFRKKDFKIVGIKEGIIVCDRSPLDPLAFAQPKEISVRAKSHINILAPSSSPRRISKGHVILLTATGGELISRAKYRSTQSTSKYLENQQDMLLNIYKSDDHAVTEISTCGRSLVEVVRNIVKVIHLGEYIEFDIHERILEVMESKNVCL